MKRQIIFQLIVVLVFSFFPFKLIFPQDGQLDVTFNTDGKVITDIGHGTTDQGRAVAVQSDGKIIVVGMVSTFAAPSGDFAIIRYNSDGSIDGTFGGGTQGKVSTDINSGSHDVANAVAIQSDGKIVVAGQSDISAFALTRYTSAGILDGSFGTGGIVTTSFGSIGLEGAYSVLIQPDGKIVAAGVATVYVDGSDIALVRYNSDGTLDTGFDTDGMVLTDIGSGGDAFVFSIAIQTDGKLVVAGGFGGDITVIRYNTDGSLDGTFGTGGVVTTDINSGSNEYANSVSIQPNGKIVVAGLSGEWGGSYDFVVVRYNSDGSLDTSFDTDGIVTTDINSGSNDIGRFIAVQSDGKIVLTGYSGSDYVTVRYNSDGSLDGSFGTGGKVVTDIESGSTDYAYSGTLQSDGKIIVVGITQLSPAEQDIALVRYTGSSGPAYITGIVSSTGIGLQNILVKLLDENGLPVEGFANQLTDFNGNYSFALVPVGNYQVMIVEPLGYMVDENPKWPEVMANETSIVNFDLTEIVLVNTARGTGYWKHQFDVYLTGHGQAAETEQDLLGYIDLVQQYYTLWYSIFTNATTFEDWQDVLSLKGNHPMVDRAKQNLAGLLMNMVSNKVGQYEVVTEDGRDVGDVVQYISELIVDGDATNDELAKDLGESANNQQMIAAGIVPEGNIIFKQSTETGEVLTYEMFNNYPNPFNPSTTIKYQIPSPGLVTLKVYDILGNELTTLVNERKEEGRYQVKFDATNLSSGVYFYQLKAGDFIETKKMVLMK